VASLLFGRVRQAILALLFTHSDQSFYVRQIARIAGGGVGAVHRELNNLVQAGLIVRTSQGNQVYYQANRNSPVFSDLRGLVVKTSGVGDVLRSALAPLADRINAAFVYGSVARGDEKAESDIDVMVVGDVDFGEVVNALSPSQDQLGREINPSVFSRAEFQQRVEKKEHFITTVLRAPKIMLIGEESELGTVA
jgi:predicted nucleotidyltransferase